MAPSAASLIWFWITTCILAILLYWPVHRLIWVLRVRKLEAATGEKASEEELMALRFRTRFITGVIVITFAFVFNHFISRP